MALARALPAEMSTGTCDRAAVRISVSSGWTDRRFQSRRSAAATIRMLLSLSHLRRYSMGSALRDDRRYVATEDGSMCRRCELHENRDEELSHFNPMVS